MQTRQQYSYITCILPSSSLHRRLRFTPFYGAVAALLKHFDLNGSIWKHNSDDACCSCHCAATMTRRSQDCSAQGKSIKNPGRTLWQLVQSYGFMARMVVELLPKRLHTKSSRISACRPGWRICHSSAPTTMGSSLVLSKHGMFNSSGRKPTSWFLKAEHGRHKTFQESFIVHSLNLLSGLCHQNHGGGIGMMEDSYQNQLADWTKHSFFKDTRM